MRDLLDQLREMRMLDRPRVWQPTFEEPVHRVLCTIGATNEQIAAAYGTKPDAARRLAVFHAGGTAPRTALVHGVRYSEETGVQESVYLLAQYGAFVSWLGYVLRGNVNHEALEELRVWQAEVLLAERGDRR